MAPGQHTSAETRRTGSRSHRRVVLAGAVGSIVEYYDFGIYGFVATIIAAKFFVSGDPTAALLATLATFAVAFVLRPVGGVLFGHLGDKFGRKNALAGTITLMAVASGVIGVVPTYAAIGVGATILLVIARCGQGIAAGGELGGAASFVAESSPPQRRGFFCATTQTGALAGSLLASLVVALLNTILGSEAMEAWGWRVPFLLAIPLGIVGILIRTKLNESPQFEAVEVKTERPAAPIVDLLRLHLSATIKCIGVSILLFSAYYVVYVYINIHLQETVGIDSRPAFWSTTACLAVATACMPFFGKLSDHLGRKPVLLGASAAALILPIPGFLLLEGPLAVVVASHVALGLIDSALMGVALSTYAEMFTTRVRYTGIALGFNLGAAAAGGTAPYICTWLVATTDSALALAYFLMATAVVTLIAVLTLDETAGSKLRDA